MRETGWQQEATRFKSKQKVMSYNFRETVSEFEEFAHCHVIKTNKVKKTYTREISKGNVLYLKLNKARTKQEQVQPRRVEEARDTASACDLWMMWTWGQCGGADSRNTERPRKVVLAE